MYQQLQNSRAGSERRSVFGKRLFVFGVVFGVRFLNVFGLLFGTEHVRCSTHVLLCSVFGPGPCASGSPHSKTSTVVPPNVTLEIPISGLPWAGSVQLCIPISMSGLPWAGSVQRGGFLFKEFWTRTVLWPNTCLVELTMSYVQVAKSYDQFQSLIISSKV